MSAAGLTGVGAWTGAVADGGVWEDVDTGGGEVEPVVVAAVAVVDTAAAVVSTGGGVIGTLDLSECGPTLPTSAMFDSSVACVTPKLRESDLLRSAADGWNA